MSQGLHEVRKLEGQQVVVALADGSRIGECMLVSAARGCVGSLWLFDNGHDVFVPFADVAAVSAERRSSKGRVA
jgi:hypothetical protein